MATINQNHFKPKQLFCRFSKNCFFILLFLGGMHSVSAAQTALLPVLSIQPNIASVGQRVTITATAINPTQAIMPTVTMLYRGVYGRTPYGLPIYNPVKLSFSDPNSIATGTCSVSNWYGSYMVNCSIQNLLPNETAQATIVVVPSVIAKGKSLALGLLVKDDFYTGWGTVSALLVIRP